MTDPTARYVQTQLPGVAPLIHAAHPCPACRGTLTLRRRRGSTERSTERSRRRLAEVFLCASCDHTEAAPPAIAARLAGADFGEPSA